MENFMTKIFKEGSITKNQFSFVFENENGGNLYFGGTNGEAILAKGKNNYTDLVWLNQSKSDDFWTLYLDNAMVDARALPVYGTKVTFDSNIINFQVSPSLYGSFANAFMLNSKCASSGNTTENPI